ncbi:pentapeptide repeat-containing protein [Rhodobacteraceae bacterium DSL-40]|uniref:pentapeptide repeat-containing protein n=1 Tax=Amaricoccus sp. B4 TaxID=3368557 RepID=UPI000DAD2F8F
MTGMFRADHTGLTLHLPLPEALPTLLWAAGAALALFITLVAIRHINRQGITKAWRGTLGFLKRHYLALLLPFGILAFTWAVVTYVWQIPLLIGQMLHLLKAALRAVEDADANTTTVENIRTIAYTFAALAGMLAILATIPFQLVRVWINERTARTQEANLTTSLINTAVEGLGAEKKISRIGRPVRFTSKGAPDRTEIEWKDRTPPAPREGEMADPGEWKTFESTQPNLEVRIGAILTLDRISRENPGEHIRVMDILCAYIRENAPASEAPGHDLGDWPAYPENPTREDLEHRDEMRRQRGKRLKAWSMGLPPARTDIQVALEVIGRRDSERIAHEEARVRRGDESEKGYRLDLRHTNLRRHDLAHLDLRKADLSGAHLEGAGLWRAHLEGALLFGARLEGADLWRARLEGADLGGAHLEGAVLSRAHLEGADLGGAHLEGADLGGAHLEGADLSWAHLEGADLRRADLKSANWAGAHTGSPAQFADFRGARDLTQEQLDQMIGNEMTLLPKDEGTLTIPSCWRGAPAFLDAKIANMPDVGGGRRAPEKVRAEFLCPPGEEPKRTGTRLPLDAAYPEGHPLKGRG